jgi:arylsulfatase A-like enzyme
MAHPSHAARDTAGTAGPLRVLLIALCFAVLAAWLELVVLAFRKYVSGRPSFGANQKLALLADYRIFWTVPLAEALTFLALALPFALAALLWPGRRTYLAAIALGSFLLVSSVLLNITGLHLGAVLALAAGLSVATARLANERPVAFDRALRVALPAMLVAVAVSSLASSGWRLLRERRMVAALTAASPDLPNVLLIILDTVRAFNLSTWGYERETTPNLTRIAKTGVQFSRAYATAPWTLPSHASMFTGRFPRQLNVDFKTALDDRWPTLAEAMRERGYLTAGFVGNVGYCLAESGLARGFAHYEDVVVSWGLVAQNSAITRLLMARSRLGRFVRLREDPINKNADRVNADFLRWHGAQAGRPFFAFLNYYDAHRPYLAPAEFASRFVAQRRDVDRVLRVSKSKLPPDAGRALVNAYDGSLTYLDDRIGRLFDELERRGALRNTIVVITSDHGEQFGEHALFYHANSLYTQLLHVPLLVLGPDHVPDGVRVDTPVSLADLSATVLDLVDGRTAPFPGQSFARRWQGGDSTQAPHVLGAELGRNAQLLEEFAPKAADIRSVIVGPMHYIKSGKGWLTEQREELFDLVQDPREEHDLITMSPPHPMLARLRVALDSLLPAASQDRAGVATRLR